jgi:hypothetical protein
VQPPGGTDGENDLTLLRSESAGEKL